MIDFACKKFDLNEVIRCGLGLSKAEFRIMKFLLANKNNSLDTNKIAKGLGFELSTVQRAVKKLYSAQILQRSQTNLTTGGYVFQYKIKDKKEIKERILKIINFWADKVESEFRRW